MSVYKIVLAPDDVLRQVSQPVKNINAGVLRVLDNMKDTLFAANGVGLAAPQIGILKRLVVIDAGEGNILELINPEIIFREGVQDGNEACLSVPGMLGWVKRDQKVRVKALNRRGEEFEIEGEDLLARAFQHEIDHLDGILFTQRAQKLEKQTEQ